MEQSTPAAVVIHYEPVRVWESLRMGSGPDSPAAEAPFSEYSIVRGPLRGAISVAQWDEYSSEAGYEYTRHDLLQYSGPAGTDVFWVVGRLGDFESKPIPVFVSNGTGLPSPIEYYAYGSQLPVLTEVSSTVYEVVYGSPTRIFGATHGTVTWNEQAPRNLTYTPTALPDGHEPFRGKEWVCLEFTQPDGTVTQDWVELDVGDTAPPLPSPIVWPSSRWQPSEFGGTLADLRIELHEVQELKTNVLDGWNQLGMTIQSVDSASDESDDIVLGLLDGAIAALDQLQDRYEDYLSAWTQLTGHAATYQNSWRGKWDLYADGEEYELVLRGALALPRDIGGLRANAEFMQRISAALDQFGEAAGVQANLASTVLTVAETTHFVLEKAEWTLGLASGGTYTGVKLLSRAGLAAVARTMARNYGIGKIVNPVMEDAVVMAADAGLNPTYVSVACLGLQGVGVMKAAKARLRPFTPPSPTTALQKALKHPDAARHDLREAMLDRWGESAGVDRYAHHLIPLELAKERDTGRILAKAAKGGFNINGVDNGKFFETWDHPGSHPGYTEYVRRSIDLNVRPGMTDEQVAASLRGVASLLRTVNPGEL